MLLLGNTRRGGTYVTVAFMQVTNNCHEWTSLCWILRLALREITLHTLCWATLRPVSS
jgi:hypothetical protein